MTARFAVVTDSTCDMPPAELTRRGIHLVPLSVFFGDEEVLDSVGLTPAEFYARLAQASEHPTTSQPPAGRFLALFQKLLSEGTAQVLCVHLSKALSGTAQSAVAAAAMVPGLKVRIVDGRTTSWGLAHLAMLAKERADQGIELEAVALELEALVPKLEIFFAVDTLDALEAGGRLGAARAFLGKMFGVRPILVCPGTTGVIEALSKTRSRDAASEAMAKLAKAHLDRVGLFHGGDIVYANVLAHAENLQAALQRQGIDPARFPIHRIGAVVGTHLGPDGWGIVLA